MQRIKIDMHIHTRYSKDCLLTLEKIIEICNRKEINCIAVTDHNTTEERQSYKK